MTGAQGVSVLLVVAAPAEALAVVRGLAGSGHDNGTHAALVRALGASWQPMEVPGHAGVWLTLSGVGKAPAAGATAHALGVIRAQRGQDAELCVLNLGVCGVLAPADVGAIGRVVVAARSVAADEGVQSPEGFRPLAQMGFGPARGGDGVACELALVGSIASRLSRGLDEAVSRRGDGAGPGVDRGAVMATVSTCSGTDALAKEVVRRTGAAYEAMEGFGVGLACERLGAAFVELREIGRAHV